MESSTPFKGGEIDSRQADAINTLSSANEYQGKSRIQTLRKLPWNRKWRYFREQLLARTVQEAPSHATAQRFITYLNG